MSITRNVSIPDGASADEWQPDPEHRILFGKKRRTGQNTIVSTAAVQLGDGRLDDGGLLEPPKIYVNDDGYTVEQARHLAAALLDAIADLEQWTIT